MNYIVLLADEPGNKLWPLTDEYYPTGMVPLSGNKPLLADAVGRLPARISNTEIFILTTLASFKALDSSKIPQVFGIPMANIIRIPEHKGDAVSMLFATQYIKKRVKDIQDTDTIAFCPVDQFFWPPESFSFHFNNMLLEVESNPDKMVSMALTPGSPSTFVDYVKADWGALSTMGVSTKVDEDKENGLSTISIPLVSYERKPVSSKAQDLMNSNWLWTLSTYAAPLSLWDSLWRLYLTDINTSIQDFLSSKFWYLKLILRTKALAKIWQEFPEVLFAPSILPKAIATGLVQGALVSSLIWSSISDWVSIKHLLYDSGLFNNTEIEGVHLVDSERNLVFKPDDKEVALFGVNDLIIIDSGDKLLIGTAGGLYDRF